MELNTKLLTLFRKGNKFLFKNSWNSVVCRITTKSNHLLPMIHPPVWKKNWSKFVDDFLSYALDRQTDKKNNNLKYAKNGIGKAFFRLQNFNAWPSQLCTVRHRRREPVWSLQRRVGRTSQFAHDRHELTDNSATRWIVNALRFWALVWSVFETETESDTDVETTS